MVPWEPASRALNTQAWLAGRQTWEYQPALIAKFKQTLSMIMLHRLLAHRRILPRFPSRLLLPSLLLASTPLAALLLLCFLACPGYSLRLHHVLQHRRIDVIVVTSTSCLDELGRMDCAQASGAEADSNFDVFRRGQAIRPTLVLLGLLIFNPPKPTETQTESPPTCTHMQTSQHHHW